MVIMITSAEIYGKVLHKYRQELKMTLKTISELMEDKVKALKFRMKLSSLDTPTILSASSICKIESGQQGTSLATLEMLLQIYDRNLQVFFADCQLLLPSNERIVSGKPREDINEGIVFGKKFEYINDTTTLLNEINNRLKILEQNSQDAKNIRTAIFSALNKSTLNQ
jgi:transcriptional regulator with XRE-family HTH domain